MRKQSLSLKRRVFVRLLINTMAAVLLFYAIGLYLNSVGIENVRKDLQSAIDSETKYIASQLQREVVNLSGLGGELSADKDLLSYAIAYHALSDYQRVEKMKLLSNRLLHIKRYSNLVETAEILLPVIDRAIITDGSMYTTMDRDKWNGFSECLGQRSSAVCDLNGVMYLLNTKFLKNVPLFQVSIGISPERLQRQISTMSQAEGMLQAVLLRMDGTPYVGTEEALAQMARYTSEKGRSNSFASSADIPALGLRLWCGTPDDYAMQPLLRHRVWVWVLTLLAGVLLAVYLLYYRFFILRPINKLYDALHQAAETGQFHISPQHPDYDDMYAQFNTMMKNIESLAGEAYEERLRAQQAEVRQLQMQINPHFFYNTLFLIYRMAQAEGSDQIAKLSLNLSNYYRYITKLPEHDVSLREEIKHVSDYLEIQGMRFSPRVMVHIDPLPEEIADEHIPPLILQPIVENAFVHGVKDKASGGLVEVRFLCEGDRFGVTVYDNGGSMDVETVRSLDARLRAGQLHEGSALYNLYRRMELCYGSKYELKLNSVDQGLMVSIMFPRTWR